MIRSERDDMRRIPLSEVCRDCYEDETDEQLGCGDGAQWHYREGGDGWCRTDPATTYDSQS